MLKITLFFILALIALLLVRKLLMIFTKKFSTQYILYIIFIFLFIILLIIYRESTVENKKGIYEPPKYNGNTVTPGRVISE